MQFAVLRLANGLPPSPPISRPRRYQYPTFESQLPCRRFSAVTVDPTSLVTGESASQDSKKPSLACPYCKKATFLASIVAHWAYIVHAHPKVDQQIRLDEIRRSGAVWSIYWDECSDGGKGGNETQRKLEELRNEDFVWNNVLAWNLRLGNT